MLDPIKIGVSGDKGSFSETAGLYYMNQNKISATLYYLTDMERVLAALSAGTVDIAIFPVVNFQGGLVKMSFDAMGKYPFTFIDDIWLDVRHCLSALSPLALTDIQHVISHSQALAQCKDFLAQNCPQATLVEWEDTAKAAKDLLEGLLPPKSAVIAPIEAANLYQLTVLAKDIQDLKPNYTVFIVTKQLKESSHGNDQRLT